MFKNQKLIWIVLASLFVLSLWIHLIWDIRHDMAREQLFRYRADAAEYSLLLDKRLDELKKIREELEELKADLYAVELKVTILNGDVRRLGNEKR